MEMAEALMGYGDSEAFMIRTTMDIHGPSWTNNSLTTSCQFCLDLHKTYCLVAISQKDLIGCLNGMRTNSMGLHTSIKQCPSMQCIVSHTAGRKELCASEPKDMDATPFSTTSR